MFFYVSCITNKLHNKFHLFTYTAGYTNMFRQFSCSHLQGALMYNGYIYIYTYTYTERAKSRCTVIILYTVYLLLAQLVYVCV